MTKMFFIACALACIPWGGLALAEEPEPGALCPLSPKATAPHARGSLAQDCRHSNTRNATCFWTYPYRHPAAEAHFNALLAKFRACSGFSGMAADVGVNHPDTSSAWVIQLGDRAIRLALKDKASQERSIVSWSTISGGS